MVNKKVAFRGVKERTTKSLRIVSAPKSTMLEDRSRPWNCWLEIYRSPQALAKELRQIADWLERF